MFLNQAAMARRPPPQFVCVKGSALMDYDLDFVKVNEAEAVNETVNEAPAETEAANTVNEAETEDVHEAETEDVGVAPHAGPLPPAGVGRLALPTAARR